MNKKRSKITAPKYLKKMHMIVNLNTNFTKNIKNHQIKNINHFCFPIFKKIYCISKLTSFITNIKNIYERYIWKKKTNYFC